MWLYTYHMKGGCQTAAHTWLGGLYMLLTASTWEEGKIAKLHHIPHSKHTPNTLQTLHWLKLLFAANCIKLKVLNAIKPPSAVTHLTKAHTLAKSSWQGGEDCQFTICWSSLGAAHTWEGECWYATAISLSLRFIKPFPAATVCAFVWNFECPLLMHVERRKFAFGLKFLHFLTCHAATSLLWLGFYMLYGRFGIKSAILHLLDDFNLFSQICSLHSRED